MKIYTVIALCLCGCKEINLWHIKAKSAYGARHQFELRQDPMWPLEIMAVKCGRFHINQKLRGMK